MDVVFESVVLIDATRTHFHCCSMVGVESQKTTLVKCVKDVCFGTLRLQLYHTVPYCLCVIVCTVFFLEYIKQGQAHYCLTF